MPTLLQGSEQGMLTNAAVMPLFAEGSVTGAILLVGSGKRAIHETDIVALREAAQEPGHGSPLAVEAGAARGARAHATDLASAPRGIGTGSRNSQGANQRARVAGRIAAPQPRVERRARRRPSGVWRRSAGSATATSPKPRFTRSRCAISAPSTTCSATRAPRRRNAAASSRSSSRERANSSPPPWRAASGRPKSSRRRIVRAVSSRNGWCSRAPARRDHETNPCRRSHAGRDRLPSLGSGARR